MGCCLSRERRDEFNSEAVRECLVQLNSAMNSHNKAVVDFVFFYKFWDETRRKACEDVIEIANQIDKHHENVNKTKIAGSAVGTAASAVAVGGAVFTGGTTAIVVVALSACAAACAALATSGAMATDKVIQSTLRKQALEHLQKDQEMTERMVECLQKVQEASEEMKNAVQRIAESVKDIWGKIGLSNNLVLDSLEKIQAFLSKLADWAVSASPSFSNGLRRIVDNWPTVTSSWNLVKGVLARSTLGITRENGIIVAVFAVSCVFQVITLIRALVDYYKGSLTDVAAKLRSHVEALEQDRTHLKGLMNAHYSHLL